MNIAAVKLGLNFNKEALVSDLANAKNFGTWTPIIDEGIADAWRGIALRSHDGMAETMAHVGESYIETPLLEQTPYIREVLEQIECPQKRVRLLALQPGTVLPTHSDLPEDEASKEVRLHIPITTNSGSKFIIRDTSEISMQPGEFWYVDVSQPHSVKNMGSVERVHLVVDCIYNTWIEGQIASGEVFDPHPLP